MNLWTIGVRVVSIFKMGPRAGVCTRSEMSATVVIAFKSNANAHAFTILKKFDFLISIFLLNLLFTFINYVIAINSILKIF